MCYGLAIYELFSRPIAGAESRLLAPSHGEMDQVVRRNDLLPWSQAPSRTPLRP